MLNFFDVIPRELLSMTTKAKEYKKYKNDFFHNSQFKKKKDCQIKPWFKAIYHLMKVVSQLSTDLHIKQYEYLILSRTETFITDTD